MTKKKNNTSASYSIYFKFNATFFIVNKQINKRLARKQKRRFPYELISGH